MATYAVRVKKNAPQIYQRMVDNALYGYIKIGEQRRSCGREVSQPGDVFMNGEPDPHRKPSVLGRKSYLDDILVPTLSWTSLYQKGHRLLEVCDQWNLSISLPKSVWGRRKVEYLGHQVSISYIEANPKNLGSLVNIPFPKKLRSMQSVLGSLNYYSRFIEDFAIYASILYKLKQLHFHTWLCRLRDANHMNKEGEDEEKWSRVQVAFSMLEKKIATAPIL